MDVDAKIFTIIDLRGAYNLIRIKKGDEGRLSLGLVMDIMRHW